LTVAASNNLGEGGTGTQAKLLILQGTVKNAVEILRFNIANSDLLIGNLVFSVNA
jgi:hypothetical protein